MKNIETEEKKCGGKMTKGFVNALWESVMDLWGFKGWKTQILLKNAQAFTNIG